MANNNMLDTTFLFQPRGQGTGWCFRMATPSALIGQPNPRTGRPYGREIREGLNTRELGKARKLRDLLLGKIRLEEATAKAQSIGSMEPAPFTPPPAPGGNPYDQFDAQPHKPNPFDQFDSRPVASLTVDPQAVQKIIHELGWKDTPESQQAAQGIIETRQETMGVVGGIRDGLVNAGHLAADVAGGALGFVTGTGYGDELSQKLHGLVDQVPTVDHTNRPGVEFTRDLTRFAMGFIGGQKLMKGLGAGAGFATDTAAGAVGDFAVTSKEDHTLAQTTLNSLVEDYPQLAGPVVDFLRSPSDSDTEQRFKNALEGVVLGSAASGLFKMVKYIKGSLSNAATEGQALKALQQGEEGAATAEAHAAASGAEETAKAAGESPTAHAALLDEAAQDFVKAQAEPHQLEMFLVLGLGVHLLLLAVHGRRSRGHPPAPRLGSTLCVPKRTRDHLCAPVRDARPPPRGEAALSPVRRG